MTKYANGTELKAYGPWGIFSGGRALCSDGQVRALSRISTTADTFFSIPASVKVNGKTISGYVTVETLNDTSSTVCFIAYTYGKNSEQLPFKKLSEFCPKDL